MAGKKKQRKSKVTPQSPRETLVEQGDRDTRLAEALTVAWMLALMATLAAELLGLIGWLILAKQGGTAAAPALVGMIPIVLFFISLVTGLSCLVLGVVVRKVRTDPPPRAIWRTAVIAGILPWVMLLSLFVMRSAS